MTVAVPLKNIGTVSAQDRSPLNFNESYTLTLVRGDRRRGQSSQTSRTPRTAPTEFGKPYDFVGTKTFGSVDAYEAVRATFIHDIAVPGCAQTGRVFVGQRNESFVVNLGKVFDLVNLVPVDADVPPDQGGLPGGVGIKQDKANDIISDANITTLALELPAACLKGGGQRRDRRLDLGEHAPGAHPQSRSRRTPSRKRGGALVQVSRLSTPLVNELVIGLPDKDRFNASEPKNDGQFAQVRDQPDAAGAARRAVPQARERHSRRERSRTSRRRTSRAWTSMTRS